MNHDIICTTVSNNYLELTLNWIENLKKFKLKDKIVVFCIDEQIFNKLKNVVTCFLINKELSIKNRGDWIEAEKTFKCLAPLNYVKESPCNLLLSDVDVVFLKNPLDEFKNKSVGFDIVTTSDKRYDKFNLKRHTNKIISTEHNRIIDWGYTDQYKFGEINGSVSYCNYSKSGLKSLQKIFSDKTIKSYPKHIEDGAAQTIFNKEYKKVSLKVKVLSVFEFANGSILNVDYLKKKALDSAIGLHYNFCNSDPYIGYIEKVDKIKKDGYWFI
jgi:hypothetical protein